MNVLSTSNWLHRRASHRTEEEQFFSLDVSQHLFSHFLLLPDYNSQTALHKS